MDSSSINWYPKGAWNQLHLAASAGDVPTVKALIGISKRTREDAKLEISANRVSKIDIPTKNGDRAVHLAFRKGQGAAALELIRAGCDIVTPGANGEMLVHVAASKGMIKELRYLVTECKLKIDARTPDGSTCLHFAAAEGRCDTLRELATMGLPMDVENANEETALHVAARRDEFGAVQWLLDKLPALINKKNKQGKDAEAVAREAGSSSAANTIKEFRDSKKKLARAIIDFQRLLASGEELDHIKRWLSRFKREEIDELVDGLTKSGSNSFLEACAGGNLDVVQYLWSQPGKRGAHNIRTGATALQIAAARGHLAIVEYFVNELDFDPSMEDTKHSTPIQEALAAGHMDVVKVLKASEERRAAMRQGSSTSKQTSTSSTTPRSIGSRQLSEVSDLSQAEGAAKVVPLKRGSSGASSSSSGSLLPDPEIVAFLKDAGISSTYVTSLQDIGYGTMNLLQHIVEADLKEISMPLGHRRAFVYHLQLWKEKKKKERNAVIANENDTARRTADSSSFSIGSQVGSVRPERGHEMPLVHMDDLRSRRDLADGEQLQVIVPYPNNPSKSDIFIISRMGKTYSCSCHRWNSMSSISPPEKRTCEHLSELRGDDEEDIRLGLTPQTGSSASSALPSSSTPEPDSRVLGIPTSTATPVRQWSRALRAMRQERLVHDFRPELVVTYQELQIIDQILGEGSFGVVRIAEWRGTMVAVKEFKASQHHEQDVIDVKREALVMSQVGNHDNVVPLIGIVFTPVLAVVMKYMPGGSVEDLLVVPGPRNIRRRVPWYAILKMMRDAAAGILHLHKQHVIHRDISARNLLVDATGSVRLSDFGFARISERDTAGITKNTTGPFKWMSLEAFEGKYSEMSDVFAFGVTMWEILKGQRPWNNLGVTQVFERLKAGIRMPPPRCPDPALPELISRCWEESPEMRPTMDEIFLTITQSWRDAKGHLARDPSGGVATIINSDTFIAARSMPPQNVAIFASDDSIWLNQETDAADDAFSIRERPSFGYSGTPAPDEWGQPRETVKDETAEGYVCW